MRAGPENTSLDDDLDLSMLLGFGQIRADDTQDLEVQVSSMFNKIGEGPKGQVNASRQARLNLVTE